MTMCRRFCCNDLLRLGRLLLESHNTTHTMYEYMSHLGMWPANCHVAYFPGGRITEYIFGRIEGTGLDCTGEISMLCLSYPDLNSKLSKLLENSCDKIYNAYTLKFVVRPDDIDAIVEGEKLGYHIFKYHEDGVEIRKPLPRLLAIAHEEE